MVRRQLGIVSLIIALGALGLAGWTWTSMQQADTSQQLENVQEDKAQLEGEAQTAAEQILALCAGGDRVAERLRQAGVCEDSRRLKVVAGPRGRQGPPISDADIAFAVAQYCGTSACAPTEAEVAAAVRAYCDGRGECRGPRGGDGTDGTDGRDGLDGLHGQDGQDGQDGEPGPPPSDAQVAAAVANYCAARNECRGPAGQDGTDGQDGQDGAQGPAGPQGPQGPRGEQGPAGPMCPAGYHAEETTHNGRDAVVCYRDGSAPPDPGG